MKGSVLVACVLLAGCGQATSAPVASDSATPTASPTPTPSASPTVSPTVPPKPAAGLRPLDDFPLVRGYPLTNGDDGSPVEVTEVSGVEDLVFCGRQAWSPDRATDVIGTTYTGEAEDVRGRTLARYYGRDATAAVATLRDAIEACPVETVGATDQVYELIPGDSVDESFFVTHRYRSDVGFDTGLEVIGVQRLDDLVLLTFEYGEGGGSADTISRSVGDVVEQVESFMPELCEYAAHPCSQRETAPVVQVGPDGVDDVTLGMSGPEAAAGGLVQAESPVGAACTVLYRDDPSGAYAVMADIRPGSGVVALWATTWSQTPEGVGTGSTAEDVAAAYPGATPDDRGWTAPVPGHPDRAYSFELGRDHLVTGVTLLLPDQRCSG
jgi:hypothetical protein